MRLLHDIDPESRLNELQQKSCQYIIDSFKDSVFDISTFKLIATTDYIAVFEYFKKYPDFEKTVVYIVLITLRGEIKEISNTINFENAEVLQNDEDSQKEK